MKKLSTLLIAVALLFVMSQCKKNVETVTYSNLDGKKVHISLKVDNNEKYDVFVSTGAVTYDEGDIIYVGDGTRYLGYLENLKGLFSGDIEEPEIGDYLYFYFIGNIDIGLCKGGEKAIQTAYRFDINDQKKELPVLSYGKATTPYTNESATYSCTLLNKCALVKFTFSGDTGLEWEERKVYIQDMSPYVMIDFADPDNGIKPVVDEKGDIWLNDCDGDDTRWAILMPQDAVNDANVVFPNQDLTFHVDIPEINANDYISDGLNINNCYFSVCRNKVQFAPGNLQATYDGNEWSWHFAANDYVIIGNGPGNTSITNTAPWIDGTGTVDLFGYSTAATYYGISSSVVSGDYSGDFVDWGTLQIDSYAADTWRSLTEEEYDCLIYGREFYDLLCGNATIDGLRGTVILPDNWIGPEIIGIEEDHSFDANTFTRRDWDFMKANGAVFLPMGRRRGADLINYDGGMYWGSPLPENNSYYNENLIAPFWSINEEGVFDTHMANLRYIGHPVRLVRNVQ